MNPKEFLQQQRESGERIRRRVLVVFVIVGVAWIPIALLVYRPLFLFGGSSVVQEDVVQETLDTDGDGLPAVSPDSALPLLLEPELQIPPPPDPVVPPVPSG